MSKGWLLGLALIAGLDGPRAEQWAVPRATAVFPDRTTVRLEVAATPATRQRGLMFRQSLGPNEGMVFVFEQPGSYPFWMQNCLISIDIIWLDPDFRVLTIAHAVPPCRLPDCVPPCGSPDCPTYPHDGQASFVIEVAAGFAKQHGLRVGDRIAVQGLDRHARGRRQGAGAKNGQGRAAVAARPWLSDPWRTASTGSAPRAPHGG